MAARTNCEPPKVIDAVTLHNGISVWLGSVKTSDTYVQFPTKPSHPLTYEANALYLGVESIAAQSAWKVS